MLRIRRPSTDQCADIVAVRQKDGIFTALVRDESGNEANGSDASQSLAVIHAAMKLFQPNVEPGKRTEDYAIDTEKSIFYVDTAGKVIPTPPPQLPPGVVDWSAYGCRMPYETIEDLRASLKFVPRPPKKDAPEES